VVLLQIGYARPLGELAAEKTIPVDAQANSAVMAGEQYIYHYQIQILIVNQSGKFRKLQRQSSRHSTGPWKRLARWFLRRVKSIQLHWFSFRRLLFLERVLR
jgi:hypothetical protein